VSHIHRDPDLLRPSNAHPSSPIAPSSTKVFAPRRRSIAKLDSPPLQSSTLHVQRKRDRSDTDNLRERSVSVRISQARGDEDDMLLGKGYSWKAARARLPPSRHLVHTLRNPRFLMSVGLVALVIILVRSLGPAAGDVQRYACLGWKTARLEHNLT
jgi:hypothetical protein